jgi:hypothetical protein
MDLRSIVSFCQTESLQIALRIFTANSQIISITNILKFANLRCEFFLETKARCTEST